jgi:hypothetical protein
MPSKVPIAHAKVALESGNEELAFSILGQYLMENRTDADGWLLMAQVAKEPPQIVDCLDRVVILKPDILSLKERLKKVKNGPLKYYNQIFDVVRGYGQGRGKAETLGDYSVRFQIENDIAELKDFLSTVKKQQRHLQELQKHINRDEGAFDLIPLDADAPTYEAETNLYLSTSVTILNIMISQALKQFEKVALDLEIRIEQKSREGKTTNPPNLRMPIPDDVKMFVWKRDQGKCVKCGSQINLEFDHIIPVSKGGSNTARNIQLLCESCNRKKSNNIS